jgi:hyperosmotically inducible periplasmic protein
MKILLLFLISVLIVDVACSRERQTPKSSVAIEPDNSRHNVRGRNEATKTPENQSENEVDRTISQNIRDVLRADDSLSPNAKNVKIITNQGMVTLRGPVKNEKEKNAIEAKAKGMTGVKSVDNQLEITTAYGKSSFA